MNQIKNELELLKDKDKSLSLEIEQLIKISEENSDELKRRALIQQQMMELEDESETLIKELDRFKNCNPEDYELMKNECKTSREAIDRWTGI